MIATNSMLCRWIRVTGLCVAGTLALAGCTPKNQGPPKPPPTVEPPAPAPPTVADIGDTIFEAWFAMQPVTATAFGDHRFDGQWPDLTPEGIAADNKRIEDGLATVAAFEHNGLDINAAVDLGILETELQRQAFEHDVERPWARNPLWYATIIGNGLEDLVSRDYAPLTERAQSTAARLEALPALVAQAQANLVAAETMKPHAAVAVQQLGGIKILINQIIPARVSGARPADRERIAAATEAASTAIDALATTITDTLLPAAEGPWRLGAENFERKLQLTLGTDLSAAEVRRTAVLEHARVRREMALLAEELAQVLFGARKLHRIRRGARDDGDTAVIRAVLEELAADHVTPPRLRDRIEANLARLQAFVIDKDLVTLDSEEVLEVIWTPPHQRGVFIAGLAAPGPLDAVNKPGLPSFYLVQPVPDQWTPPVRESFLREYNNFMIEILSIHEAIPGHFVQLYYGKREPSKIRKFLANGAFVEGWAVYAEKVMVDAGYAGIGPSADAERPADIAKRTWTVMNDPELRAKAIALHGLKFYLRSVTNAILDHSVHAGTMTEQEAVDLLVQRSFQQEGEARSKWVRAQVTSTQLSTYFVGAQAWHRLRNAEQARRGPSFELKAFHDEALSHGAPPVHRLPELMWTTGPDAEADEATADEGQVQAEPEAAAEAEAPVDAAATDDTTTDDTTTDDTPAG